MRERRRWGYAHPSTPWLTFVETWGSSCARLDIKPPVGFLSGVSQPYTTELMLDVQYALHAEIEDHHWWFAARRAIVKRLLERVLSPRPDALVIDVGCGTGANIAALSASYRCVGLDESPRAIEFARARFPGVEYAIDSDLRDGASNSRPRLRSCSWMCSSTSMTTSHSVSQVLSFMRPGAHLLITVPADPSLWTIHDERASATGAPDDAERLRASWHGLAVDERLLSPYNSRLYPIIKAVRALSRLRRRPAGAAGTDFTVPPLPINRLLERVFAGEASALEKQIDRNQPAHARGASLLAILRRRDGEIAVRGKPSGLPPDRRVHAA